MEAELRRTAGKLTGNQDTAIEIRTDMLLQCRLGFPVRTEDSGVVWTLLFIDVATQAARMGLSRSQHGSQNLQQF